ncbi:MAG TPA: hypothetical protein VN181_09090, partial [Thermoanaerobaculia bacterium]|nr:hypothetical protein [Thermoanaerobaculia bacterium]
TTGTFRKSGGTGSFTIANTTFTNNGTLQIQSGTFDPATFGSTGPVQLSGGTFFLVNSDSASLFAGTNVTGAGLLQQVGATLTVDGNVAVDNLQLDSGTLNGSGVLAPVAFTWNGGAMSGTGTTQMSGSSTLTIASAAPKTLSRPLTVTSPSSTVTISGTGTLSLAAGGSITNAGLINVTADMTISGSTTTITNNATFRKSVGPGTLLMSNLAFDNAGTLDVQSGIVDLASGTNTSVFQIAGTCEVLINSDTYNLNSGSSVTGAGKLKLAAGNIVVSGVPVQVSNFQMIGGVLTGTGTLDVLTNGDWAGGSMQGAGITLASGSFSISGAAGKSLNGRAFNVGATGIVNLNGTGSITLTAGGSFTNGGTFVANADNSFLNGGGAGAFTNSGTFTKQTTTGSTTFSNMAFTNSGTVDLQTGILAVTGAFSQTSGLFKLHFGGTVAGTQFSQLQTASNPTLGGTLQVLLVGVYQPNAGDAFRAVAIPGGAHTGTFTPNYPALSGGKTWSEAYDGSGLLLSVNGSADLTMGKTASVANVQPGAPIAYTLTVNNAGPDAANSVSVTDVLQTGHSSISANGTGWTCGVVTLTVTCTAASLPTGVAPAIIINANAPLTPQTFTNVANVNSSNDPTPGNNSGSAIVTVDAPQADLAVSGFAAPAGPVASGTPVT